MLKTIIKLPDGTEISSGSNTVNAIQSCTITECVNSGEDLTLGSTCASALEATLITPNGGLKDIGAGTRVTVFKQEGDNPPVQVGVFNLEKPTRSTANTMKLTGYDRITELDKDLTDWLNTLEGWPFSLTDFADMVCEQCGLTFKVTDVPNADFQVPQFTRSAVTGRQIMQWLGEICCRFCRADAEGNIEFAWYTPSGKTIEATGDMYYFQNSLSYENYQTAAIDAVQIRLANSENGALWPAAAEAKNSYIITDNAILNAQITEALEPYLQVIQAELDGVAYTPCKVSVPACLDIRAGNTVDIIDKNGIAITAYVMTKTQKGQQDTLECTGNSKRNTTSAVNSQQKSPEAAAQDAFAGMTQEQIFKKLTNDGQIPGLFMKDGQIYVNVNYLASGYINSDLINGATLKILKGATIAGWEVDNNSIHKNGADGKYGSGTFMSTGTGNGYPIGGSEEIAGWVFGAGGNFGVTKDGAVWGSNIHVTGGEVEVTSEEFGTVKIGNGRISLIKDEKERVVFSPSYNVIGYDPEEEIEFTETATDIRFLNGAGNTVARFTIGENSFFIMLPTDVAGVSNKQITFAPKWKYHSDIGWYIGAY